MGTAACFASHRTDRLTPAPCRVCSIVRAQPGRRAANRIDERIHETTDEGPEEAGNMAGKIDEALVRHIAHLSRLKPSDDEVRLFSEQLSRIVEYVEKLNELDTEGVEPTAHALPIRNVFRDDVPTKPFTPGQALANAPQRDGNFFAVPKVLDPGSGA